MACNDPSIFFLFYPHLGGSSSVPPPPTPSPHQLQQPFHNPAGEIPGRSSRRQSPFNHDHVTRATPRDATHDVRHYALAPQPPGKIPSQACDDVIIACDQSAGSRLVTGYDVGGSCPALQRRKQEKRKREAMLPLLVRAFMSVPDRRLAVDDMYHYIVRHSRPNEYTRDDVVWHKNVRHLLSTKCFFSLTDERKGKGRYWVFNEEEYEEFKANVASRKSSTNKYLKLNGGTPENEGDGDSCDAFTEKSDSPDGTAPSSTSSHDRSQTTRNDVDNNIQRTSAESFTEFRTPWSGTRRSSTETTSSLVTPDQGAGPSHGTGDSSWACAENLSAYCDQQALSGNFFDDVINGADHMILYPCDDWLNQIPSIETTATIGSYDYPHCSIDANSFFAHPAYGLDEPCWPSWSCEMQKPPRGLKNTPKIRQKGTVSHNSDAMAAGIVSTDIIDSQSVGEKERWWRPESGRNI